MAASAQKNRLGRGLASLIGEPANSTTEFPQEGLHRIVRIENVRPSSLNPRQTFSDAELEELATSIREKGLIQPLIVRPSKIDGSYDIVAGERRWRGAQMAHLSTVPVIVRDLSDQEVLELAIIENVQRSDLNAIEEAQGYRELIDRYDYSQEDVAQVIGKSRSHLANTLRLLKLPGSVQQYVKNGDLSAGHARALIGHALAEDLAREVIRKGLSVREVEAMVQSGDDQPDKPKRVRKEKDADTRAFERELTETLGLQVEIKPGAGETGQLVVKYGNFDQLDYVRQRLTQLGS